MSGRFADGDRVTYTFDDMSLEVEVVREVEGWFEVRFSDNSCCIVRPSRLSNGAPLAKARGEQS